MRVSMASKKDAFRRAMARYLGECRSRDLSWETIYNYTKTLRRVHDALVEADLVRGPKVFGEPQARIAYEALNHGPQMMRNLNIFLRRYGNDVLQRTGFLRPLGPVTRRRWLDTETGEDLVVYDTAMQMGPPWSTLVHLELKLLFRRISCLRSRLGHFTGQQVLVHGKGRHGGKFYTISPHPDTAKVLRGHEAWRVSKPKGFQGDATDHVFLARRKGYAGPYNEGSKAAFDEWLKDVEKESGIRIRGHHTLRRTGGRKLWIAGVPLETVSGILGHESVDMTIRYLGINISDMEKAQRQLVEYETSQRLVRVRQERPSGTSQSSKFP